MKMTHNKDKILLAATILLVAGAWPQICSAGEPDFPKLTPTVVVPGGDSHWHLILIGLLLALALIACAIYVIWPGEAAEEELPYSRKDSYFGHRNYCDKNKISSPCLPGRGDAERWARYSTQTAAISNKRKGATTHRYVGFSQTITEKSKETKRVVGDVVQAMEELSATTGQLRRTTSFIKGYAIQSRMAVVSATTKSVSVAASASIDMETAGKGAKMCSSRELAAKTVNTVEEAALLVEGLQGRAMKGLELAWDLQTKIFDIHEQICRDISPQKISKKHDGGVFGVITEPSDEESTNYALDDFFNDITDFGQKAPRHDNGFHIDARWPR